MALGCNAFRTQGNGAALAGGEWHAITVEGRPAIPADIMRRPSMRFDADSSRVTGSSGCNRFTGTYSVHEFSLTLGAIAMTRMACLDSALNAQETAFEAALRDVNRYAVARDTLTLSSGPTARLRFTR